MIKMFPTLQPKCYAFEAAKKASFNHLPNNHHWLRN